MADIQEAIRRLKYLYEVHGADQVTAAQAAITASTTTTERAALSLEKGFNSLERKYVSTVRAQQDYARVQEKVNAAIKQNPALLARGNVILEQAALQYQNAGRSLTVYGKALDQSTQQGRLARHELINLSRQIQDVGVGIVSGQSPFTILVQQGAQIADVFASSTGTLAGFFKQAGAGAARFATSTAGIATGVAAVGAAITYSAVSFSSGQRDIERSLSGIGRASGVTRDQINDTARATSSWSGLSISQARAVAQAFAGTGKVQEQNLGMAVKVVDAWVRAGGDATEVTKTFSDAMLDPAKNAAALNKQFGFLDATLLKHMRALQAQGKLTESQDALMEALLPKIEEQTKLTGGLAKGWNVVTNSMSDWMDTLGRQYRRDVLRIDDSQVKQLEKARKVLAELEKEAEAAPPRDPMIAIQRFDPRPLEAARENVQRLEQAMAEMRKEAEKRGLSLLGLEADAAGRAIMPTIEQIEQLGAALSRLRLFREQSGGPVTGAEQVGAVRLRELQDQEAATVRLAQETQKIAEMYPGMSVETARQLFTLQEQLAVASARTPAEALVKQEIATQNMLLAQGKTMEEAVATAAAQRAVQQAQINAAVQGQNLSLQNQLQVSNAVGGAAKIEAQHRATIVDLIRQGVAPSLAVLNADLQRANALAQINSAARESLLSLRDQNAVSGAVTGQQRIQAEGQSTFNKLLRDGVDEMLASEIAAQQVANAIAAATAAVEQQIIALKESTAMINAQMNGTEIATAAQQAYNRAIRSGADEQAAAALAVATRVNLETRELAKLTQEYERLGDAASRASSHAPGGSRTLVGTKGTYDINPFRSAWYRQQEKEGKMEFDPSGFPSSDPFAGWVETEKYKQYLREQELLGGGKTPEQALAELLQGPIGVGGFGKEGTANQETLDLINRLIDLMPEEGQAAQIQKLLTQIKQQPVSLAREELIKKLNDQLKGLTESVDALNGALSPYYSQDPRTTKLGFRAGSVGNADWLTGATNQTAIDTILGKGATAPGGINITAPGGVTVTGPGSTAITGTPTSAWPGTTTGTVVTPPGIATPTSAWPGITGSQITPLTEAQRRQREITGINNMSASGSAPTVVHNDNRIVIQGSVDEDTLSKLKISRYQQTQRMRGAMTAA